MVGGLFFLDIVLNLAVEEGGLILGELVVDVLETGCPELALATLGLVVQLVELYGAALAEVAERLL